MEGDIIKKVPFPSRKRREHPAFPRLSVLEAGSGQLEGVSGHKVYRARPCRQPTAIAAAPGRIQTQSLCSSVNSPRSCAISSSPWSHMPALCKGVSSPSGQRGPSLFHLCLCLKEPRMGISLLECLLDTLLQVDCPLQSPLPVPMPQCPATWASTLSLSEVTLCCAASSL